MHRIQIRKHPGRVVTDDDRVDSIRIEHGFGQPRVDVARECADYEKWIFDVRHSPTASFIPLDSLITR